MSRARVMNTLETDRLILRPQWVEDAGTFRRLWTERDFRVPAHRRITAEGRPSVGDIAAQIRKGHAPSEPGLLAVQRRDTAEVIGYCGLNAHGNGTADEPELAYELLQAAHGFGYATEAGRAVVAWAGDAGFRRLWAGVWDWNVASRRVLEKLGFREVGEVESDSPHGVTLLTLREI